ncbi:sugar ABC transporter substrate-binding protein [Acidaminobacter sp. JC074]|uniref:ABC transporter substrate-binding protein n=1 Tax=Acidaminobacter sp. JC074 TaxID=2530199 RepID=UPI001F0EA075|nr:sugar ABC transporter substrate-binding protein [Acidaminobacter sp. JC074]MCH4891333.1 sugar ABC transporter substrate-binding protein [Acidaminobacter sp. JC074]
MRNLVKILILSLAMMLVLIGCSDSTDGSGDDGVTTITFMNYSSSGANEETLMKMVNEFESKNPNIKVDVRTYGFGDYFQQLATTIAGNSTPDVFELNIENFRAYQSKGVIAQIEGADTSQIHPTTLKAFAIDGKQYGLPTKFSNVVMIYNKDLFDQAGLGYPTKDWTWDDELEAAKQIRALGEDYFGVFRPIQTWEFYKTVEQNGGSMMNDSQTAYTINSDENVQALQMMIDRINDTNVTPNADQMGGMGDWDLFKSGRLGMIVTGIWAFPDFTENCDFNWDIVVEPGIDEKATHFFSDAIVVSEKSSKKEAAVKFASFISGSSEAAKIRLDANWDLPVALTDDVTETYLSVTPPENKQAVIDSLDYLVMPPSLEDFSAIADTLGSYLEQALAGKMTPKEALDKAQEDISSKYPVE